MHYVGKGVYGYIQCDQSRRKLMNNDKLVCTAKLVRYDSLFDVVFNDISGLDISELTNSPTDLQKQKIALNTSLQATDQLIREIERKQSNLIEQIADEDNKALRQALSQRHIGLNEELEQESKRQKDIKTQLTKLEGNGKELTQEVSDAKDLKQLIDTADNEEKAIELRLHLRAIIKRLIKRIRVYPAAKGRFKEQEELETGLYVIRKNRYMDKVIIYYNGTTKTVKTILPLKYKHELED